MAKRKLTQNQLTALKRGREILRLKRAGRLGQAENNTPKETKEDNPQQKYSKKQEIIPEVKTPESWKTCSIRELRKNVYDYITNNYEGLVIRNKDLNIDITIIKSSARKTARGEAMYYKKAAAILILPQILENAVYNNWGWRKNLDSELIIGYMNFKCKVIIDDKKENLRVAIRFQTNGKFYYSIEVNKNKKSKTTL